MPTTPAKTKPTSEDIADEALPKPESDDQTFTVGDLIARGQDFFGKGSHIVAGAFHDVNEHKQITLQDAKQRIREWEKGVDTTTVTDQEA